jgi:hypothetical protein
MLNTQTEDMDPSILGSICDLSTLFLFPRTPYLLKSEMYKNNAWELPKLMKHI